MTLPSVSASASKDNSGKTHLSLCNINPNKDASVEVEIRGINKLSKVKGEIVTASAMNAYNDFNKPEEVNCRPFSGYKLKNNTIQISLPSKSVVTLEIE